MGKQRHTRETIVETLQSLATRLGKSTSKRDVQSHIPHSSVRYHFGSFSKALEAAGLSLPERDLSNFVRTRLSEDELFASLYEVEQKIGHEPSYSDYRGNRGPLSITPFKSRFGTWNRALQHYRKWKSDRSRSALPDKSGLAEDLDVRADLPPERISVAQSEGSNRAPPRFFGEPIDFRGLRHAPINEQGVVYLFGMISRELGFYVEALQQGFPDCEAKYLYDEKRNLWAKARVEFEFKASNVREHCHDPDGCDFIVCWENDWPDCPLRVIELKSEIVRLPSR